MRKAHLIVKYLRVFIFDMFFMGGALKEGGEKSTYVCVVVWEH